MAGGCSKEFIKEQKNPLARVLTVYYIKINCLLPNEQRARRCDCSWTCT